MTDPVFDKRDGTKLPIDLHHVNSIANSFNDCLDPDAIARRVTDGIVEKFGCVFARIWLMEADRTALKLVASSGLYCRTDGFFARVPIGAFKVGKIAQNQIPFLSNQLAAEPWVLDRLWHATRTRLGDLARHSGVCGLSAHCQWRFDRGISCIQPS